MKKAIKLIISKIIIFISINNYHQIYNNSHQISKINQINHKSINKIN